MSVLRISSIAKVVLLIALAVLLSLRFYAMYKLEAEVARSHVIYNTMLEELKLEITLNKEEVTYLKEVLFGDVIPKVERPIPKPPPLTRIELWMQNSVNDLRTRQERTEKRLMTIEDSIRKIK